MAFEGREFCGDGHRLHVADVAVVQDEGKVVILAICLDCGKSFENVHQVTSPHTTINRL